MIRALIVACALLALGCGDAGRMIQARTADAVAQGANAGLPALVDAYRGEGLAVIDAAKTREEAEAGLTGVRDRWAPVWQAWGALQTAQHAWATTIENGGDSAAALDGLKVAYCGLRNVWPDDIPAIPLVPVKCEEPKS